MTVDDISRIDALRQSEEVFRGLFEQSAVGVSLHEVSHDGRPGRVRWNSPMREMLGMDPQPDDTWETDAEDHAQAGEQDYSRLLSGEVTQLRQRRRLIRRDGKVIWADVSTVLVRDRDDQPLRFQTMALDITEQVEAEQRLSRRVAQETVLRELSRQGLEGCETSDFLATAVELVARGTKTQFAQILELRPADGSLVDVAAFGHPERSAPEARLRDASQQAIDAISSDAPVLTFYHLAQAQGVSKGAVVASMVVGIRGRISPFGAFWVHTNLADSFSAEDLEFMQLASTIISVAIERKRGEDLRRLLLRRLVNAQEAERHTIADDIHDDAVQVMTAANARVEILRLALTDQAQRDAAQKLQETVSLAIERLRTLLFELVPPDLDRHGLAAALKSHLEQLEEATAMRWELEVDLEEEPAAQAQILLFRIFQEALANVHKHAQAALVRVSLVSSDGGVMMRVLDDGIGFWPSAVEPLAGHLGVASMRERAEIVGGWGSLTSRPGHGTEVCTWVPIVQGDGSLAEESARVMSIG